MNGKDTNELISPRLVSRHEYRSLLQVISIEGRRNVLSVADESVDTVSSFVVLFINKFNQGKKSTAIDRRSSIIYSCRRPHHHHQRILEKLESCQASNKTNRCRTSKQHERGREKFCQ